MKKIVVLASLLVSLSFGLNEINHHYTLLFIEGIKKGSIGGYCKSVQDKVKGCFTFTTREDDGLDQAIVYKDKKIVMFFRAFKPALSPIETEFLGCGYDDEKNTNEGKCQRFFGGSVADGGSSEEFTGDWNELVKKYVKQ